MKLIRKLNFQLFFVTITTVVILTITLGLILPYNIKYYFDDLTFEQMLAEQTNFMNDHTSNLEDRNGYLHLKLDKETQTSMINNEHFKDLFLQIDKRISTQRAPIDKYVYHKDTHHIYYVINKSDADNNYVTIKMDTVNSVMAQSVFYRTATALAIILSCLLVGILFWSYRLVMNLKDIKRVVQTIEKGDLDKPIRSNVYTTEINDLMKELDHMRNSLKQNEALKQEMIHNISHDLKSPISIIKMCSESIMDGIYPYGTPEASAHVIYNQADRLEKKVKKLLYLNHLDYLIDQENKNPHEIIHVTELIKTVVQDLEDKRPDIKYKLNLEELLVTGDEEKWRVIFENLIDNAQRFSKTEIMVTIKHQTIEIYNDGPPIKESERGSIFKPFEVGVGGVTGLGLAIVYKSLSLYHYTIHYENLSNGVKFVIEPK